MAGLLEKKNAQKEKNAAEIKQAYCGIVCRDVNGTSQPGDAAMLGELQRELNITDKQVENDVAALKNYFAAKKNVDAFDFAAVTAAVTAAYAEVQKFKVALDKAQADFAAAMSRLNVEQGAQINHSRREQNLAEFRRHVSHLLD